MDHNWRRLAYYIVNLNCLTCWLVLAASSKSLAYYIAMLHVTPSLDSFFFVMRHNDLFLIVSKKVKKHTNQLPRWTINQFRFKFNLHVTHTHNRHAVYQAKVKCTRLHTMCLNRYESVFTEKTASNKLRESKHICILSEKISSNHSRRNEKK